MSTNRELRLGMIGGGPGAFIGAVHRLAAEMDRAFELTAGAFSSDADKSAETGQELGLDPKRVYSNWEVMLEKEASLPQETRIHAVSIVTPNHLHHPPAIAAMRAGFHVICDKPMTTSSELALEMESVANETGKIFALTHNYTGYPMVREACELVQGGAIGTVRKAYAEYLQGWLTDPLETTGQKQAEWRTDPSRSGPGGALGDIGTHAFNLLEHVIGKPVTRLAGRVETFVEGRELDDDAMVLVEMENGATGSIFCSQVCAGRENGLRLRIYGTEGGIEWDQEHPNDLLVHRKESPSEVRRTGNAYLSPAAQKLGRIPSGHPEGYLEGFANLYRGFAAAIQKEEITSGDFPTAADGVRGVRFIEAVLQSASENGKWVRF